jgi:hypothetical protein
MLLKIRFGADVTVLQNHTEQGGQNASMATLLKLDFLEHVH